jgi:ketose-bisphosphate aldolase
LITSGYEREPAPFGLNGIPEDFAYKLLPPDWDRFLPLMQNSVKRVPAVENAEIRQLLNGPERFTPDGEFLLGPTSVKGFWGACAFCAHGLAGAGGIGKVMAERLGGKTLFASLIPKGRTMSIENAKGMLIKATEGKYAIGAFNITDFTQLEGVIEAAVNKKAPLIIQTSVEPSQFFGRKMMVAAYRAIAASVPIPICLHLDHCTDADYCKKCADAGYTNIMIDASKLPFEENVRVSKQVAEYCHKVGDISVEAELGTVSGVEDQIKVVGDQVQLANPDQAVEFVARTGIDLFAPAIGTAHGVYTTKDPKVDFERMGKIAQLINGKGARVPLVVHGGTGLPPHTVAKLIEVGSSKFNISTELKYTLIDATFNYITEHRKEYNPGKINVAVKNAIREAVEKWIDLLGSAGKA